MDNIALPQMITGVRRPATDATLLMVINGHHGVVRVTMPPCTGGAEWQFVLDTNIPDADEGALHPVGTTYATTGRSLLLFKLVA